MAQLPSESLFGDYSEWPGRDVLDSGGERLGGVREIYLDRETGHPEWVLVDVEGDTARFVPLADAQVGSATIQVAHSANQIRSAPGIGAESQIDQTEERQLYAHYGLGYSESDSGSGLPDDSAPVPQAVDETIASAAPPVTSTSTPEAHTETFESATPPWRREAEPTTQPTGWGTSTPPPSAPPPTPWETPEPSQAASTEPTPTAWGAADADTSAPEETSSWSAAATDAPPPAEPPSPEEIEAADIPEPPITTDRAVDFDAPPATDEPTEPTAALPPSEPAAELPPAGETTAPADPSASFAPPSEPTVIFPPTPTDTPVDPALAPPAEAHDAPLGTPEDLAIETPPPLTPAVSPPELATAGLAEAVVPDELPGGPEPDPVSAASVPPRPAQTERPAWTSPPPQEPAGALALLKDRQVTIAIAAVVATVLFLIVRRLR